MALMSHSGIGSDAEGSTPRRRMTVRVTRARNGGPLRRLARRVRGATRARALSARTTRGDWLPPAPRRSAALTKLLATVRQFLMEPRGSGLFPPPRISHGNANPGLREGRTVDPMTRDRGPWERGIVDGERNASVSSVLSARNHGGRWPAVTTQQCVVGRGLPKEDPSP
jgi:hypothetical protein